MQRRYFLRPLKPFHHRLLHEMRSALYAWIDITKEHYGLHGTPERLDWLRPSHGCVRLTNRDAQRVAALVQPGTRVVFE